MLLQPSGAAWRRGRARLALWRRSRGGNLCARSKYRMMAAAEQRAGDSGPKRCHGPGTCPAGLACCRADGFCKAPHDCHWRGPAPAGGLVASARRRPPAACPLRHPDPAPCERPPPPAKAPPNIEAVPRGIACGPAAGKSCPWVFGGDLCCAVGPGHSGAVVAGPGGRRRAVRGGACVRCDAPMPSGRWYWDERSGQWLVIM